MPFTDSQKSALEVTERVSSVFSLLGSCFVFATFLSSKSFRKPFNRLIVYASLGNTALNIATLISLNGVRAGQGSSLCQFQGFLVQMFVPADAFWNLVIAWNLYLTLYHNYNADQLRALDWKYFTLVYGTAFVPAFVYCFVETSTRGKVYGPAGLWCWVSLKWDFIRLVTCYGPAWFCIAASFFIYVLVGRRILAKRSELHFFNRLPSRPKPRADHPANSFKVVNVHISYERNASLEGGSSSFDPPGSTSATTATEDLEANRVAGVLGYTPYSVKIEGQRPNDSMNPILGTGLNMQPLARSNAMNSSVAAQAYIRCASLFFVTLLITWIPSSINRVYTLVNRDSQNFGLNYAAALVLPLMGFWNCVIYITISWTASKVFCSQILFFH